MKNYQIISSKTKKILFAGSYASFIHCIEDAVKQRITMPYADLTNRNLSNASLDDAILPHADFTYTNLSGTNISEAYLKGAKFDGAALFNTCLAYSNLRACDFRNASFGATDISGTILSQSQFSTLSCFSLDFTGVKQMDSCLFIGNDGRFSEMSKPPVVIHGIGNKPIILTDTDIRAGHNTIDQEKTMRLMQKLSMREIQKRIKRLNNQQHQTTKT